MSWLIIEKLKSVFLDQNEGFETFTDLIKEEDNISDEEKKPDKMVSADMSCLMHLSGLANRQKRGVPIAHLSQVLRDSIK